MCKRHADWQSYIFCLQCAIWKKNWMAYYKSVLKFVTSCDSDQPARSRGLVGTFVDRIRPVWLLGFTGRKRHFKQKYRQILIFYRVWESRGQAFSWCGYKIIQVVPCVKMPYDVSRTLVEHFSLWTKCEASYTNSIRWCTSAIDADKFYNWRQKFLSMQEWPNNFDFVFVNKYIISRIV